MLHAALQTTSVIDLILFCQSSTNCPQRVQKCFCAQTFFKNGNELVEQRVVRFGEKVICLISELIGEVRFAGTSAKAPLSHKAIPLERKQVGTYCVVSNEAYRLLQIGFVVAPIVAGVDKFFNLLIDWNRYLPAFVKGAVGGQGHELMMLIGVIEIVAGLGVALKPRIFCYVVAGWLGVIIVNLLLIPGHFDVALRDVGLMIGALALARLSHEFNS